MQMLVVKVEVVWQCCEGSGTLERLGIALSLAKAFGLRWETRLQARPAPNAFIVPRMPRS